MNAAVSELTASRRRFEYSAEARLSGVDGSPIGRLRERIDATEYSTEPTAAAAAAAAAAGSAIGVVGCELSAESVRGIMDVFADGPDKSVTLAILTGQ